MKNIYKIIIAINLFFSFNLSAQYLSVPQTFQEHSQWCWDGCSKCVLTYFGYNTTQCSIANWAWNRTDCCGNTNFNWYPHLCDQPNYLFGNPGSVEDVLLNFGNILSYGITNYLSLSSIQTEITAGRPFIFGWAWTTGEQRRL